MFDYMIKKLDNGRLLVRDSNAKTSKVLKADEISSYFENVLKEQLERQEAEDEKIASIKKESEQTYKEWCDERRADIEAKKAEFKESK